MQDLAKKLNNVDEYVFATLAKKVKEVEHHAGLKVLNLGVGSPNIAPKEIYLDKFSEYLYDKNSYVYPGYGSIDELKSAIIDFHQFTYGYSLVQNEITIANGSKDAVVHIMDVILDQGDEILIPNPGYPAYTSYAKYIGAIPIFYELKEENMFLPVLSELDKLLTERTKAIWLNFPSNPTGAIIDIELLNSIVKWAIKKGIWILYDNAYSEIFFTEKRPVSIFQIEGAKDCAVELFSFSKGYSLAGYRIAWVIGNVNIINGLNKVKSLIDSGTSLPLQKLATFVLNDRNLQWQNNMRNDYALKQKSLAQLLSNLGLKYILPSASLYIWVKIPEQYLDSFEYAMYILENEFILLTPGTAFGSQGKRYVRASICADLTNYLMGNKTKTAKLT